MTLAIDEPLTETGKPRGDSSGWDRDFIALLALLTTSDLITAAALWDALSPRANGRSIWAGLLLATAVDDARELAALPPGFWFDRHSQRYGIDQRGAIPTTAIRAAFASFIGSSSALMRANALAMARGQVDVSLWQQAAGVMVKSVAVASAALGKGGLEELTDDERTAVSESLEFHFTKLERFAGQVAVLQPERIGRRAGLYPVAAALLYPQFKRLGHEAAGFDSERRVLSPAEHCPVCPELAALGWVEIGSLPDIGDPSIPCSFNCKCSFEFRRQEENANG